MTTIDTITDEQIEKLRTQAGTHGDAEQVALCDAALNPTEGDRIVWTEGPAEDHDTGRLVEARYVAGRGAWRTTIAWDSETTTQQWYEIVPTEAAHACVEAIRGATS